MQVKAKLSCESKREFIGGAYDASGKWVSARCTEVTLRPVMGPAGSENATWSSATPGGEFKMTITNQTAVDAFELGKEYLVTFEPAPALAVA